MSHNHHLRVLAYVGLFSVEKKISDALHLSSIPSTAFSLHRQNSVHNNMVDFYWRTER
jgi:hypothetical protein